jgi:two-component system chemotaxis response regulator CheY
MKGTVLVVDDMRIIRDPIAATLKGAGYRALTAANGKEALEMLPAQPVDLVLLDVNMPVMGGLAFLRALRADAFRSDTSVIMLSGAEDREHILQAAKLGIKGYVLKSHFSLKDLMSRVTQHFAGLTPAAASQPQQSAATTSPDASAPGDAPSGKSASPDASVGAISKAVAARSRSGALLGPGEIPSLITREECIERAKKSLHGRTLSGVVGEVIAAAASPRGSAGDLTAIIARDPLLAARVLQVANSAAYASAKGAVTTLPEAVRNIGSAAVRNIAAALGVFNAIPASDSDGLNLLRCWQHSFAAGTLCNRLATKENSGLAYLVGLCHDLGEILFHSQFAEEYQQVLELQQSTGKPRAEVEKIVLGMSQGQILQTILKCLGLPDQISIPIQEYHTTGPEASGGAPLTRLLRVADLYANGLLLGCSNHSPLRPITCAEASAVTGLENPPQLDRVAIRGEILGLTATLSRFSSAQQAEVMASPYARRPVKVWLAGEASLSSLDPIEAALELLAEVKRSNALPDARGGTESHAIVAMARSSSAAGFTAADVQKAAVRPDGGSIPILWLVGNADEPAGQLWSRWPISTARLAEFVAAQSSPEA